MFHAILNGSPQPPIHLRIDGSQLFDVRTDVETWTSILKKVLSNKTHPGITTDQLSFETLVKIKAETDHVYVLEEHGNKIEKTEIASNSVFVLGDHVGLPVKAESFALRYGEKVSLGRTPYLAASCITVINYLLDSRTS
jgi:tRNA pseudouridine-54 N-methylase